MKMLLYTISVIIVVSWALGYFVYSYKASVHLLLFLAVVVGMAGIMIKSGSQ